MFDMKKYLGNILKKTDKAVTTDKPPAGRSPVAVFDPLKAEPPESHSCCGNSGKK